ncbi:MAG TPA: DUF1854 domain-containing protein [Armatimonadota bacterium]|nr:DUF1854 domain-containing protein [Armatimonadota bacterium]
MAPTPTTAKNDLRVLDPRKTRLYTDSYNRLQLEIGIEERYGPVRAVRCLPLTRPDEFISIQADEGDEIGIIPSLAELDRESLAAVEKDLELYYLKADVLAIRKVDSRNGVITWDLDTSMGPRTVYVRDRQNIRPLPDGSTILTDIYEAKYRIPPTDTLDDRSRHWLEIEL